jgi:hypothetical protein
MTKVVHVRWHDSSAIYGWRSIERLKRYSKDRLMIIDTVGLLAFESSKKIILLQSTSPDEIDGIFEIPKGCIKSMKTICKLPIEINWK